MGTDVEIAGVPAYIYRDLGGVDRWIWFVCPYETSPPPIIVTDVIRPWLIFLPLRPSVRLLAPSLI